MTETKVQFIPLDAVHAKIVCSNDFRPEIRDAFSFEVPGVKFQKRYRKLLQSGEWDGRTSLFKRGKLYIGLKERLHRLCSDRGYDLEITETPLTGPDIKDLRTFVDDLNIPEEFEEREYQFETLKKATSCVRALFLSPTSSGKSMMIYQIVKWYNKKTLIIVPRISLVHQMAGDFLSYGEREEAIHKISAGEEKWSDKNVTITTWQSAITMKDDPDWWKQFEVVIGDEAHLFAAKSLITIMENLKDCHIRFGFTGSLDESRCNAMTLEGLFGPVHVVTTTRELMDDGYVANIDINIITIKHPDNWKRALWTPKVKGKKGKLLYPDEVNYIIGCEARNNFIADLTLHLEGNTLVLYQRIADHGDILYEILKRKTNRPIHYIHGKVSGKARDDARPIIEQQDGAIVLASFGTFSTGINIKRIHNIVMASSFKSRVTNLQSIGRGLRKGHDKELCNLYDLTDDLSWKKNRNYTMIHCERRIQLYNEQDFNYQIDHVQLEY